MAPHRPNRRLRSIKRGNAAAKPNPYLSDGDGVNYMLLRRLHEDVEAYERDEISLTELNDRTDIKLGESGNFPRRRKEYKLCEAMYELTWIAHYSTPTRKLTEGLVHEEFREMRAQAPFTLCSCGSRHREWFKLGLQVPRPTTVAPSATTTPSSAAPSGVGIGVGVGILPLNIAIHALDAHRWGVYLGTRPLSSPLQRRQSELLLDLIPAAGVGVGLIDLDALELDLNDGVDLLQQLQRGHEKEKEPERRRRARDEKEKEKERDRVQLAQPKPPKLPSSRSTSTTGSSFSFSFGSSSASRSPTPATSPSSIAAAVNTSSSGLTHPPPRRRATGGIAGAARAAADATRVLDGAEGGGRYRLAFPPAMEGTICTICGGGPTHRRRALRAASRASPTFSSHPLRGADTLVSRRFAYSPAPRICTPAPRPSSDLPESSSSSSSSSSLSQSSATPSPSTSAISSSASSPPSSSDEHESEFDEYDAVRACPYSPLCEKRESDDESPDDTDDTGDNASA
ncbi:hypothetical protein C8F04DRAFT_1332956 [Mycena alexandri]|uniref:Bacteriophage T5 Orf172 DNA-binding domain-containing protein n=1 Tax=Mycena alexandri TaxID=1745969 RepID=A0AAD6RYR0_9AGAR|nr:hypothetical protein C8F04DRAFT_1332956 [Mycena alexandri]